MSEDHVDRRRRDGRDSPRGRGRGRNRGGDEARAEGGWADDDGWLRELGRGDTGGTGYRDPNDPWAWAKDRPPAPGWSGPAAVPPGPGGPGWVEGPAAPRGYDGGVRSGGPGAPRAAQGEPAWVRERTDEWVARAGERFPGDRPQQRQGRPSGRAVVRGRAGVVPPAERPPAETYNADPRYADPSNTDPHMPDPLAGRPVSPAGGRAPVSPAGGRAAVPPRFDGPPPAGPGRAPGQAWAGREAAFHDGRGPDPRHGGVPGPEGRPAWERERPAADGPRRGPAGPPRQADRPAAFHDDMRGPYDPRSRPPRPGGRDDRGPARDERAPAWGGQPRHPDERHRRPVEPVSPGYGDAPGRPPRRDERPAAFQDGQRQRPVPEERRRPSPFPQEPWGRPAVPRPDERPRVVEPISPVFAEAPEPPRRADGPTAPVPDVVADETASRVPTPRAPEPPAAYPRTVPADELHAGPAGEPPAVEPRPAPRADVGWFTAATPTAEPAEEPAGEPAAAPGEPATAGTPPVAEPVTAKAPPVAEPATTETPPVAKPTTQAPPAASPATTATPPAAKPATAEAPPASEPAAETSPATAAAPRGAEPATTAAPPAAGDAAPPVAEPAKPRLPVADALQLDLRAGAARPVSTPPAETAAATSPISEPAQTPAPAADAAPGPDATPAKPTETPEPAAPAPDTEPERTTRDAEPGATGFQDAATAPPAGVDEAESGGTDDDTDGATVQSGPVLVAPDRTVDAAPDGGASEDDPGAPSRVPDEKPEASADTVLPIPEGTAAGSATALRAPTMLHPVVAPGAAEPAREKEKERDPEQVLAAYQWRFHHETLRELVEDPDELRAVRDQLTAKLEGADDNASRARLLSLRAVVSRILGDLGKALADGKLALAHAEATGELRRIAIAQARLAHVLQWRGDYAEADRLNALANSPELPDRLRATMHEHAGRSCYDQGRYIEACNHFEKALDLRKVDDPELIARTEQALDAVLAKVAQNGWGPYPRDMDEILQLQKPPVPTFSEDVQRWGYADREGELVIAADYAEAQPFREGVAWVRRPETEPWELVDESGRVLIAASAGYLGVGAFHDGLAWVSHNGRGNWLAIDKAGQVVIAIGFDDVRPFRGGVAAVRRGAWGAVDKAGRTVVPPQYTGFATALTDGRYVDGFTDEGLAVVDSGGRKGVVDRTGRVIVAPRYPALVIHPVAFLVGGGQGLWGALDRRGEPLIDIEHGSRAAVMEEIDRLLADTKPVL